MKNRFWLVCLGLLMTGPVYAQNCDTVVSDEANVLGGKLGDVVLAANALNRQSLDVRVVTLDAIPGGSLEAWEKNMLSTCSSWRKTNRVVFVVSPSRHKLGLFYGSELKPVLDQSAAAIKSQFMGPAFASKDVPRGLIQGMQQVGTRMQAFNEAALHPEQKTTVVNNQASDNSGFVAVFGWIVGIGALFGALFGIGIWWRKRNDKNDEVFAARQEAKSTSAAVADKIRKLTDLYAEQKATGTDVTDKQKMVDLTSEAFSNMASSETYNPDTPGLSAAGYKAITVAYSRLLDQLDAIERPSYRASSTGNTPYTPSQRASKYAPERHTSAPASTPAASAPVVHNTYVDNSNYGGYGNSFIPVPVIIEDERPVYREPAPEPEPAREPAYSAARSDSGSSSTWTNSSTDDDDNGSSSDSDDSSSSDDSGSSDSF